MSSIMQKWGKEAENTLAGFYLQKKHLSSMSKEKIKTTASETITEVQNYSSLSCFSHYVILEIFNLGKYF
jgi:hypothetical protein